MEITNISQMVATVGFPIVGCLGMAVFFMKTSDAERQENAKREERYLSIIENQQQTNLDLTSVIADNTQAINTLRQIIEIHFKG